ncbi:MAG: amino acid adenylation domain-containing protein, partial [Acidobacteriota bacterium]
MQRLNQTSALSSPLTQQLMPRGEQHQVVWSWNDTATRYPQGEACLHELVEAQVARTPEAIAVSVEGEQLSYRQLEQRAERLAARLRTLGVAPDVVVGICAERSVELVVGLLAILKAGGAYLPLDPSYPRQRLSFMLSDARAPVLLIQQRLRPLLPAFSGSVLAIEEASQRTDARSAPRRRVRPANLAYVIYTSGSTGRPKGVLCHHRGIVNRLLWMEEACQLTPADRVLQKTPASFDVSIWELFAPLVFGARLVLARPGGHRDPDYLARRIAESRITLTHFVPSMLRIFLEEPSIGERCKSLRRVVSSGEALSAELAERFDARLGATGAILQNLYGPTEAAVEVTSWCCQPGAGEAAVPIGRPIANVRIQLLDQHLRLLPAGVAGELHIGGVGLARGYWGRPGQTAEQFIPSPFATGERLYKSGDLARARPTGAVDFLGRIDQQVKVRGFRIEPGEIEAALSTHPAVRAAAVLATASGSTTGEQRLQACVVLRRGADPAPDDADLRDFLAAKVPPAMIPSAWMRLDRLPLTPSGKLDRTALDRLAAQHLKSVGSDQSAGAARTELEATVLALLQQLLGLEKLGIHQDLFALGAHSLVVAQLLARLRQQLHLEVSPPEVFAARTVAALAERLEAARRTPQAPVMPPLRPTPRDRDLPLSFPQERVWFLNQLVPGMLAYNVQFTIRLHGTLQPQLLERSFSEIVRRHELLRTTFPTRRGKPVQLIHPPYTMRIPRIDLRAMAQGEREGEVRRCIAEAVRQPFDITQLPLVRLYLFTLEDQQNLLLQIEQHFVHDGWSISRILSETQELYTAYAAGRPSPLPELEVQYADFAVWQRRWLRGEVLQRQLRYWTERLAGSPLEIDLPLDRRRGDAFRFRGDAAFVELPAELYTALRAASRRQRMSLFMTALAAFLTLLHRYGGQKDIVLGTTVANRRLQETESLIGMMVNTILLRNDLSGDPRFTQFLTQVLRTTLEAQEYQDLPFDKLVEALQPERHLSRNPLFQVMFSFHDSPVPELDFGGLTGEWQLAHNRSSKMDLNVTVVPRAEQRARRQVETAGDPIRFIWEFNTDVFDRTTILRLSQNYRTLLEALVADPEQRLSELPLLQPAEHHQLFNEWGLGELGHGHAGGLHHLVQRQVQQTPEAIALVTGEDHLSYRQLDAQAGQLARDLRRLGVGPEVVVGVCMERSPELLVALLAILTARGVYLPVDPHYPEARRAFILGDAQARLLLTQKHLAPAFEPILRGTATKLLALEAARPTAIEFGDPGLDAPVEDEQLAYLIYTSGSTGHPKGVGVRHSSAV